MPRIAFFGPAGSFTEAAARSLPEGAGAELVPAATVPAALDTVREAAADGAVVPLENSVEGSVSVTVDELATGLPLVIAGEVLTPVSFQLLARPGTALSGVRTVATHPHAAAQCRRWLRTHRLDASVDTSVGSTAEGAAAVARGEYDAAIAAAVAGQRYGLLPLASDIGDRPGAVTRFVLVRRPGAPPRPTGRDRTSLAAFITEDHPGALMEVLQELAVRGVNLSRLESRPTGERLGQYYFAIDCDGHIADPRVGEALAALHRICADVRYLGSYPRDRSDADPAPPRPGASDDDFRGAAEWLAALRTTGAPPPGGGTGALPGSAC